MAVPQTKYWKFRDNYFDNGASGFGVWTSTTSGSGVQTGQLSCTLNIPETASATVALFNVRTTFYVLFAPGYDGISQTKPSTTLTSLEQQQELNKWDERKWGHNDDDKKHQFNYNGGVS